MKLRGNKAIKKNCSDVQGWNRWLIDKKFIGSDRPVVELTSIFVIALDWLGKKINCIKSDGPRRENDYAMHNMHFFCRAKIWWKTLTIDWLNSEKLWCLACKKLLMHRNEGWPVMVEGQTSTKEEIINVKYQETVETVLIFWLWTRFK